MTQVPVVVFGSGITALGTIRTLGRDRIPCYHAETVRDFVCRSRWHRSLTGAPAESMGPEGLASYLALLPFDKAVLMPCSDLWSTAVARLPEETASRFVSSVAAPAVLDLLVDKASLAERLGRLAIPHPHTLPISSEHDLDTISDLSGYFLKPHNSQLFSRRFGVKALSIGSRKEAVAHLRDLAEAGLGVLLQEYVPGPPTAHYFVDGFVDRFGTVLARFARRRLRMFPLDYGNSTLMVSVPLSEVREATESLDTLLGALGYRGIFSAEFKHDERDGHFKLLEVNTRPWWYVEFAALSGVDVCRLAYADALEMPVEPVDDYEVGARLVFLSQDLRSFSRLRRDGMLGWSAWLRSVRGARRTVFSWGDPLPAVSFSLALLREAAHRR